MSSESFLKKDASLFSEIFHGEIVANPLLNEAHLADDFAILFLNSVTAPFPLDNTCRHSALFTKELKECVSGKETTRDCLKFYGIIKNELVVGSRKVAAPSSLNLDC